MAQFNWVINRIKAQDYGWITFTLDHLDHEDVIEVGVHSHRPVVPHNVDRYEGMLPHPYKVRLNHQEVEEILKEAGLWPLPPIT